MADLRLCSIPDCGKKLEIKSRGLCEAHYKRFLRYGDPKAGKLTMAGDPMKFLLGTVLPYDGDECLIWPYTRNKGGYGRISIKKKQTLVSRYVCTHEHGPPSGDRNEAAHSCNNGHAGCVAKRHLVWKTRAENEADKKAHGSNLGSRSSMAKLTDADVTKIRGLIGSMPQKDIAEMFGVVRSCITSIKKRTTWSHLP